MTSLSSPIFSWAFSPPKADTFQSPRIREFVDRYIQTGAISIDPFARNSQIALYTNDLNEDTNAMYHLDALDFLVMCHDKLNLAGQVEAIIFDPPYSPTQVKMVYSGIGLTADSTSVWRPGRWTSEKEVCDALLQPGGIFLWFGWNTNGIGFTTTIHSAYITEEIFLCRHGSGHNDTICMAERKVDDVKRFFQVPL